MTTVPARLIPDPGYELCDRCEGKGEVRLFIQFVGIQTFGCKKCLGRGEIPMRTTRHTGALWFARELACLRGLQVVDNDGTYFFTKGGLALIDDLLPQLRREYAKHLREHRLMKLKVHLGTLNQFSTSQATRYAHVWPPYWYRDLNLNAEIVHLEAQVARRERYLLSLGYPLYPDLGLMHGR